MQPERNFNQQGEDTTPDRVLGRAGRRGRQWFSSDLPVNPAYPMTLIVTYSTHEFRERIFDILTDGTVIGHQKIELHQPGAGQRFCRVLRYRLPRAGQRGGRQVKSDCAFPVHRGKRDCSRVRPAYDSRGRPARLAVSRCVVQGHPGRAALQRNSVAAP